MSAKTKSEYEKVFSEPCEFWTSEDGMLMSLAILPLWNAAAVMRTHHVFRAETFIRRRMKRRFAFKERVGAEFFDGNSGTSSAWVWRIGDDPTPYPVFEYELKIPR